MFSNTALKNYEVTSPNTFKTLSRDPHPAFKKPFLIPNFSKPFGFNKNHPTLDIFYRIDAPSI